jgi:hypothetical protein
MLAARQPSKDGNLAVEIFPRTLADFKFINISSASKERVEFCFLRERRQQTEAVPDQKMCSRDKQCPRGRIVSICSQVLAGIFRGPISHCNHRQPA